MNGPPAMEAYYNAYQWYKSMEIATPLAEFALAGLTLAYLTLYQRP